MKRKVLYIIFLVILEFIAPDNAFAGIFSSEPSLYISLTQEDYQALLNFKFMYEYEKTHAPISQDAISLSEANTKIEQREKTIDDLNSRLNDVQKENSSLKQKNKLKDWNWSVGAEYLQSQKGGLGFGIDCSFGYKGISPTLGMTWMSHSGWGYKIGVRYSH